MKPWKQGRHGARLKDWVLTGPGGGFSRMPYAPEGATGNDDDDRISTDLFIVRKNFILECETRSPGTNPKTYFHVSLISGPEILRC
jgi:hypothetical protein